jgi:hypothetical protein
MASQLSIASSAQSGLIVDNFAGVRQRDAVGFGDYRRQYARCEISPHFSNGGVADGRLGVIFGQPSTWDKAAPFGPHVSDVIAARSHEYMGRVAARRVVATMAPNQSCRPAASKFYGTNVRSPVSVLEPEPAVTAVCAARQPWPAFVSRPHFNPRPKSAGERTVKRSRGTVWAYAPRSRRRTMRTGWTPFNSHSIASRRTIIIG